MCTLMTVRLRDYLPAPQRIPHLPFWKIGSAGSSQCWACLRIGVSIVSSSLSDMLQCILWTGSLQRVAEVILELAWFLREHNL